MADKKDNTLRGISRAFGIPYADLMVWQRRTDFPKRTWIVKKYQGRIKEVAYFNVAEFTKWLRERTAR